MNFRLMVNLKDNIVKYDFHKFRCTKSSLYQSRLVIQKGRIHSKRIGYANLKGAAY